MENAVGYKESGKDVYGIMNVREQHDCAKKARSSQAEISQIFFIPEQKCHQERQAGVAGKK